MFHNLLILLCLADLVVILMNTILASMIFFPHNLTLKSITLFSDWVCHVAFTVNVFLIIAISGERHTAVSSPFTYAAKVKRSRHCIYLLNYIIFVVVGAIALNIPELFSRGNFKPHEHEEKFVQALMIYQIFHPMITIYILPIIVLIFLNVRIVCIGRDRIISKRLAGNSSLVKMAMTVVLGFIILNIPTLLNTVMELTTIPDILECHKRGCPYYISWHTWVLDIINRYLVTLNCSTNFLFYCILETPLATPCRKIIKIKTIL